jgi:hypothetical protein
MMDGTDRIELPDVAILGLNERVVLCRVHGKVVSIAHLRLLPGTVIPPGSDHGTLVVTRAVAENLGLVPPVAHVRVGAESREHVRDRRCHDCGRLLAGGEGWIVPLDYPGTDRLLDTLDRVPVCDLCLLGRCERGTGSQPTASIDK